MKGAVQHIHEPLFTVTGLIFFPLGFIGAVRHCREELTLVGYYIGVLSALCFQFIVADLVFYSSCNAFSVNTIRSTVLQGFFVPFVSDYAKVALHSMDSYPVNTVVKVLGFNPVISYVVLSSIWVAFLAYTSAQAHILGQLVEKGDLGLGFSYGIPRWREVREFVKAAERLQRGHDFDGGKERDIEKSFHAVPQEGSVYGSTETRGSAASGATFVGSLPGPSTKDDADDEESVQPDLPEDPPIFEEVWLGAVNDDDSDESDTGGDPLQATPYRLASEQPAQPENIPIFAR